MLLEWFLFTTFLFQKYLRDIRGLKSFMFSNMECDALCYSDLCTWAWSVPWDFVEPFKEGFWPHSENTFSLRMCVCIEPASLTVHLRESLFEGLRGWGWSFALVNLFSKSLHHMARGSSTPCFLHYSSSHHSPCVKTIVFVSLCVYAPKENTLLHPTLSDLHSLVAFVSIIHDGFCLWEDWWNRPCEAWQYTSERSWESFGNRELALFCCSTICYCCIASLRVPTVSGCQ